MLTFLFVSSNIYFNFLYVFTFDFTINFFCQLLLFIKAMPNGQYRLRLQRFILTIINNITSPWKPNLIHKLTSLPNPVILPHVKEKKKRRTHVIQTSACCWDEIHAPPWDEKLLSLYCRLIAPAELLIFVWGCLSTINRSSWSEITCLAEV